MKIGFFKLGLNNSIVRTIFSGMYSSFFSALERLGISTKLVFDFDFRGLDYLVVPFAEGQESESAKAISKFNGPVIVYTTPANNWFKSGFIRRWKHRLLFVYSTDASNYSNECYRQIGLSHLHLPFGSDETIFKPIQLPEQYDILFIANAWSGTGRYRYIDQLVKKATLKNWKVMLFGGGWERYGFSQQLISHGKLLNLLYNSSKININLFNDEQNRGKERCLDANNRLFDLAMGECFQLCNAPEIVEKYFDQEEVVAVANSNILLEKIDYYLVHENARKKMAARSRKRALDNHTWNSRAIEFKNQIEKTLPLFDEREKLQGISTNITRKLDYTLPTSYPLKMKAKKAVKLISRKIPSKKNPNR